MKVAFITGSSRGIGLASARLLSENGYKVIGYSRSTTEDSFEQISLDLSSLEALGSFEFPNFSDVSDLVLINNAGAINPVKKLGSHSAKDLAYINQINLTTPLVLANQFIKQFGDSKAKKVIINISSGAAFRAISAWAPYCSSKAGLEMLGHCIMEEQPEIRVVNLSPGVVDTEMQSEIRSAEPEQFELLERFKNLKEEGQLKSPEKVAAEVLHCINDSSISGPYRHSD